MKLPVILLAIASLIAVVAQAQAQRNATGAFGKGAFSKPELVPGGARLTPPSRPDALPRSTPPRQPLNLTVPPVREKPFTYPTPRPSSPKPSVFDRLPPIFPTFDRTPSGTPVPGIRYGKEPKPNPDRPVRPEPPRSDRYR